MRPCLRASQPRAPRWALSGPLQGPGAGTASLGWRPVLLVVCIRFALLPALGAVVVAATIRAGWYKCPNPLYAFILLLTVSPGPAQLAVRRLGPAPMRGWG